MVVQAAERLVYYAFLPIFPTRWVWGGLVGASPTLSHLLSRAESSPCGGRSSGGLSPAQLAPTVATHTPSLHLQEVWVLLLQPFL